MTIGRDQIRPRVSKPQLATVESEEVKRELVERLMSPDTPISQNVPAGKTAITSLWPGALVMSEAPSGATYRWDSAGAIVLVANKDVEFVMSKNRSGESGCCGSGNKRTYFQID